MTRERGACYAALGPLGTEKEEREEEIRFPTNSAPLLSVFGSAYAPNKNTCPNLFYLNSFPFWNSLVTRRPLYCFDAISRKMRTAGQLEKRWTRSGVV